MGSAPRTSTKLIPPYGGELVDIRVTGEARDELIRRANSLPAVQLSARSVCDLELLATGAFSPLDRFMEERDYLRVLEEMRLADGTPFPIPITLPVMLPEGVRIGAEIALRSPGNMLLGVMRVDDVFEWDATLEARSVYGTTDARHPLVAEMTSWARWNVSGPLRVAQLPKHYDFPELRKTPAEVRAVLDALGYANVVAFQTRNPIHRAH